MGMIDFSKFEGSDSKFLASLSDKGGYITFSNSGKGSGRKYFTLGLSAFAQMLDDIQQNQDKFAGHESYNEKEWRDLGSEYFTDQTANAQITVQTKPVFSTLSKILAWANPHLENSDLENSISLVPNDLQRAVTKLRDLELTFLPSCKSSMSKELVIESKNVNKFALRTFEHFYSQQWDKFIERASLSERSLEGHSFTALSIESFQALLARFDKKQSKDSLKSGGILRYFSDEVYVDEQDRHYYFSTQWNGEGDRPLSFRNLKSFFEKEFQHCLLTKTTGGYKLKLENTLTRYALQSSFLATLPKPFILLAGISGTGKTRFVREQAAAHGLGDSNLCIVPVRPDWHEPSDLLGYVSRIGGKPEYVSTKVLKFIIESWKAIAPHASESGPGDLNLTCPPYWLCLDEMNLAPVEQYFSDYLSVLESRTFKDRQYKCDPLLDKSILVTKDADIRSDLMLGGDEGLWAFFLKNGITLPPNLIVAGTVNMDETTHGFSRKVIDRAFTLDFGEFFPNDYSKFFTGQNKPKILTYGLTAQLAIDDMKCVVDSDGQETIGFLTSVNDVLRNTPFELAYRALNELLLHVNCFAPESKADLQAVWDDFLMTKVLPRIDGDEDKLRVAGAGGAQNLLEHLEEVLENKLNEIWGDDKTRIDLLSEQEDGSLIIDIKCRSKKKIKWMKDRLSANTFTSFWP
jgi:hypothetical protein